MKFSEYRMAYRMVQAKRLIETTGDKIIVIAGQVGYTQLNNFYVHFKEYYGFSPTALRDAGEIPPEADKNADEAGSGGREEPEAGSDEIPGNAEAADKAGGAQKQDSGENGGAHEKA